MAKHKKSNPLKIVLIIIAVVVVAGGLTALGILSPVIRDALTPASSSESPSSSESVSSEEQITSSEEDITSSEPEPEILLNVTAPAKQSITVNKPQYTIKGSGDPAHKLKINGEELTLSESGLFAHTIELKPGKNKVDITHKEKTVSFEINYQLTVIKSVSPAKSKTVESKAPIVVSCTALKGSKVTATFSGETITLQTVKSDEDAVVGEYEEFAGSFEAPVNNNNTKSYGKVTFKATSQFGISTKYSGDIKVKQFDPEKYDGGNGYNETSGYLNVGTTYVMEVVYLEAETFDAEDATDPSRPTNNYLPKGTVDYCSPYSKTFTYQGKEIEMYTARYGKQLYKVSPRGTVNTKIYKGTLPETNKIKLDGIKDVGHHTVMTLDVDWKAPFRLDYKPQSYKNPSAQNYTIESPAFRYIDITFCYAESFTGLPDFSGNPVFSHAEIIKGEYDTVLRIHLREQGKFYGWSAEYNSAGQLEFWFLNPVKITSAENKYGVSLEGVRILVDAGHGGYDNGAYGFKNDMHEQHLNIMLALEVEKKLKELGADVIMTRTDDSYVTVNDRIAAVKSYKPDYVVSIHRNGNENIKAAGFSSYYFNPYSFEAANRMLESVNAADVFEQTKWTFVRWHLFFLCRVTECPSVLTENGFVSNPNEYEQMLIPENNDKNAEAIVDGIVNYFKTR